jgi:hypothetical protein
MALSKFTRSPHSPSPIYGIRPGFTIADLEGRYMNPLRVYGTFSTTDSLVAQATATDAVGVTVSPHARVIKVSLNVTGTGTVDVLCKSAVDSFVATTVDFGAKGVGTYAFFVGGWSTVDSDATSYQATQYGPVGANSEATASLNKDTSNNYVGQTYNPFRFLSLDGYDLKFFATVVGTVGYDMTVEAVS